MILKYILKTAYLELKINKSRSILTMLGILIGVTAIIVMLNIGKGAQTLILNQVQGIGSKTIFILPGREPKGVSDITYIAKTIMSDSLKQRELEALKNKANIPYINKVLPVIFGVQTVSYQGQTFQPMIFGTTDDIITVFNGLEPKRGFVFSDEDVRGLRTVAVIGSKIKDELFENEDPIGRNIKIKETNFRVIGIIPKQGPASFMNFDETIAIPYTTAQHYIFGFKYFNRLIVEVDSEKNVSETADDITTTLRELHNIKNPDKDDFSVLTQENLIQRVGTITNVFTWFLVAVAAISLIVGGVGIMNIMLVSVTERTREIGLRKAIGATNQDIRNQFLFEAVFLTFLGGAMGIALGMFLSFTATLVLSYALKLSWPFTFSPIAPILGFSVATLIGLIFGIYPAKKASQKDPVEALRYE